MGELHETSVSFLAAVIYAFSGTSAAFTGINGRVIDQNNKPIEGVSVTLVAKTVSATTKADGTFELLVSGINPSLHLAQNVSSPGNAVLFNLAARADVSASLFDTRGRFVMQLLAPTRLDRGAYSMSLPASALNSTSRGIYFAAIRCGGVLAVKKIITLGHRSGGMLLRRLGDAHSEQAFVTSRIASAPHAVVDTVRASKSGYFPRHFTINSYSDQNVGDLSHVFSRFSLCDLCVSAVDFSFSFRGDKTSTQRRGDRRGYVGNTKLCARVFSRFSLCDLCVSAVDFFKTKK